jgi:hypothetical protein
MELDDDVRDNLIGPPPAPRAAFRGRLRRQLLADGEPRSRPPRLRARVTAFAGTGLGLLLIATVSVAGLGPLAS